RPAVATARPNSPAEQSRLRPSRERPRVGAASPVPHPLPAPSPPLLVNHHIPRPTPWGRALPTTAGKKSPGGVEPQINQNRWGREQAIENGGNDRRHRIFDFSLM